MGWGSVRGSDVIVAMKFTVQNDIHRGAADIVKSLISTK